MVKIYTDGACKDNTSAWSVVALRATKLDIKSGVKENASNCNNEAELLAILKALEYIVKEGIRVSTICTDSAYVLTGVQKMDEWKQNGWKNVRGRVIKNYKLWKAVNAMLHQMVETNGFVVSIVKVKAHSSNSFNEKADKVARQTLNNYLRGGRK